MEQKNQGKTKQILKNQIIASIPENSSNSNTLLAYEPIWAIGSGIIPTLIEINEIQLFIKHEIKKHEDYKILYGGSVKSSNSKEILNLDNVDGLLVGGASLNPKEFEKILNS